MERSDLAPYAARSSESRGRRHQEPFKDSRPAFERDRDRIIHSAAFRRLEYKTQVFVNHEGDYYRTRLTHSLEVAQIARGIARRLRLNEDLVEALALAHDLGHTPFGHSGEEVLNRLMADQGGFEHNRQSLRIVELLEERYPGFRGLNLSWETREGIIKHSVSTLEPASDAEAAEYDPSRSPTLEAQLIDLADEIAYNNHDIDDGLKSGYITLEDLEQVGIWRETWELVAGKFPGADRHRHVHQTISHLIGTLIHDLVDTTTAAIEAAAILSLEDVRAQRRNLVGFSSMVAEKNRELKTFLHKNLYRHYKVERMRLKTERCLLFLFEAYVDNPQLLPREQREKMALYGHKRAICDYIAGMTDRYALDEYRRLIEPYEPV
ncbi:deoxyguanosinetriphosphate triphosphohydrolase [Geoalkalibacter halelectricus]|uniref:Deoxyguanosinetriphosphate triphosphohydrolase-like protein n=1 Tax=Geoalkalibacter halelectricus TaxID=2847045 RepID=A0ABY5ZRI1_9BACT|nr:deoxyguanosinetriphosphate triphosphohydrolase [Geoalkalibacter halelectricus]MDO3379993.1 deoxyguanosinetriphosphate triphosphohydrolase [Geoalkalibacter halelectricus]UWZ80480.1 deoxyguanosinetriphosphate triphosphohydrolase [Geoalkalibacter halelectricus]